MNGRHKVELGDNVFYIRRFEGFTALEILGDLQKQFAGPFLASLDGKQSATKEEAHASFMGALAKLSASIDGKTLRDLAKRLLDPECVSVSINGAEPRKLDATMMGLALTGAADILQLCWEIITYNFAEVIARINSPIGPAGMFQNQSLSENSGQNSLGN